MSTTEILSQSVKPAGIATDADHVRVWKAGVSVRWRTFMLATPRPAEDLEDRADLDAARAALAESGPRVPYEDVRRELGLA